MSNYTRPFAFSYTVTSCYRKLAAYKNAFYCAIHARQYQLAKQFIKTHDALESDLNAWLDADAAQHNGKAITPPLTREAQPTFDDGQAMALTIALMKELSKPSQQANTALYEIAEELYFLLSERASA